MLDRKNLSTVYYHYHTGPGGRVSAMPRRKMPVDYASDSEAMTYTPSIRASLPAATRRSLGLTNGRSNSLPRDLIRGRGVGRKPNVRFDKRGPPPDLTSGLARRRNLLLGPGMDSQDESDGALSAPEMPLTPRQERGKEKNACSIYTETRWDICRKVSSLLLIQNWCSLSGISQHLFFPSRVFAFGWSVTNCCFCWFPIWDQI